ncbi:coiled-coil-helix-coiled-coil-helix domain-containing protein 7 [Bufo gargarizans]|uniref:coiled-coil-helix-coiled-coil-helix domain-containing protein 7 n=1 Tax=Bufo gargarizans TaxID=30331 RepID=UPI001CF14C09|nr:coiled-coil-helix-coiled-coil-helix domain-containing protein 7 [Bufo gargarizans]
MPPQRKMRDVDINPCLEESDAAAKCLDVNNYQRDMCALYFHRYKQCRKFWQTIMLKRRADGVNPAMPTAEERKHILASFENLPY